MFARFFRFRHYGQFLRAADMQARTSHDQDVHLSVFILFKNGDFLSMFARSTSAVKPSEKSSIITNRKSTTCFPMSLR